MPAQSPFKNLMSLVVQRWSLDENNYPEMQGLNETQRMNFALKHGLIHQMKALGKLAAAIEPFDHGGVINEAEAFPAIAKMMNNILLMTDILGMSAEELLYHCERELKRP